MASIDSAPHESPAALRSSDWKSKLIDRLRVYERASSAALVEAESVCAVAAVEPFVICAAPVLEFEAPVASAVDLAMSYILTRFQLTSSWLEKNCASFALLIAAATASIAAALCATGALSAEETRNTAARRA